MQDELQDYERPVGRPAFITVLCILTFIGSGWRVLSEGYTYFSADSQAAVIAQQKEKASADIQQGQKDNEATKFALKMVNSMNTSAEKIKQGAMANMGGAVLCLVGAFMMWKLQKRGFYLYLAGTLIGIISPFIIFGGSNMISIMSSAFIGFFGLIFVILYGVNLKHMK